MEWLFLGIAALALLVIAAALLARALERSERREIERAIESSYLSGDERVDYDDADIEER